MAYGANNILKDYEDDKLKGIAFIVDIGGKQIPFKVPARVERVEKRMMDNVKRPRKKTFKRIRDQAGRTAWKILSDWVDIQMSIIELDQVEFMEVFLPYVYDPAKAETFFEKIKGGGFKLLEAPK